MKLLVVESPAKTKKIQEYLGAGFEVVASFGHFRDLPSRELGVDLHTFEPTYVVKEEKASVVARLKAKAAQAELVYLATDADREGEAIAWHLTQALRLKGARRIRFTEITPTALQRAVAAAGPLDTHLVDAQQARRVLDRLVGYQVSPLLRPFGNNHSAGRVQSATLHLVAKREQEREAFKAKPYWTLTARYLNGLLAKYATLKEDGELVETRLPSEAEAEAVKRRADGPHVVESVDTQPVERRPRPPFTTSTLLQAASAQLDIKPGRAMELAQRLFEGGHITYHRSDSVALSEDAVAMARDYIARDYPEGLPENPPRYRAKEGAQEAHEAIRPTHLEPELPEGIDGEAQDLYRLIRRRFLSSQCKPAVLSQTTVGIHSGDTTWRARGSTVQSPGFLHYLDQDEDTVAPKGAPAEPKLPPVQPGQVLDVASIDVARQETKPPPRFTEATLIKEMERVGIGRPSTYKPTLDVLFAREYLAEEKKALYPTERGRLVDGLLAKAFGTLVEASYTADMETRLDEVAAGKRRWKDELRTWYGPFQSQVAAAGPLFLAELKARPELAQAAPEAPRPTGKPCPRCGAELLLRQGKRGPFLSCSKYPVCEYAADPSAVPSAHPCPKCGQAMEELDGKHGRYARCLSTECGGKLDLSPTVEQRCPICEAPMKNKGAFLGCSRYPACQGTLNPEAYAKALKADKRCPACQRLMVERRGSKGSFWACSGYPVCKHTEPSSRLHRGATRVERR